MSQGAENPQPGKQEQAVAGRLARRGIRLSRPVLILGGPHSGEAALFTALARSPDTWTLQGGSELFELLPALHPSNRGWDSNRLTRADLMPGLVQRLRGLLSERLIDRDGNPPPGDASGFRLLLGGAKNSLRVPFFNGLFPDAVFVYVFRDPREALPAMLEAWESGSHVSYPRLPDWPGPPWSMLLTPEWRALSGKPTPEVVAEQWAMANRIALADLERLAPDRWSVVDYALLAEDPQRELERVCGFADLEWEERLSASLTNLAEPVAGAATADELLARIEPVLPRTAEQAERAREWIARPPESRATDSPAPHRLPFRSVSTANLPDLLEELGCSLLVTTYQSGRLVSVRRTDAGLNTHFRGFESPMGLARRDGRLAVGTRSQVFEYQNVPALCEKIEPVGSHDACFVPRRSHYTGDIRIHEIDFVGDELGIVATRFSCLATLDNEHSFVPRWHPPFISALAAEDRCHLNGMAVVDQDLRFVTALGTTDAPGGWREKKADGGVVIDVPSSEIVVSGLSMPHSPRWYRERLWVLESGEGSLGVVDLATGSIETVAELPGFTRGLSFIGPLAFVGLSQVREATTFGGLPLTGRLEQRHCGVWVVNIDTGETVAFLRFEGSVQEIFEVQVLDRMRFPEIAEHGSDIVNLSYVLPQGATGGA